MRLLPAVAVLSLLLSAAVLATGCETMSTKVDLEPVQPVRYSCFS